MVDLCVLLQVHHDRRVPDSGLRLLLPDAQEQLQTISTRLAQLMQAAGLRRVSAAASTASSALVAASFHAETSHSAQALTGSLADKLSEAMQGQRFSLDVLVGESGGRTQSGQHLPCHSSRVLPSIGQHCCTAHFTTSHADCRWHGWCS